MGAIVAMERSIEFRLLLILYSLAGSLIARTWRMKTAGLGIYYFFTTRLWVNTQVSDNTLIKTRLSHWFCPEWCRIDDKETVIIEMTMCEAKGKILKSIYIIKEKVDSDWHIIQRMSRRQQGSPSEQRHLECMLSQALPHHSIFLSHTKVLWIPCVWDAEVAASYTFMFTRKAF